jgi:DNA polymerase II small subunit/DNA polymerase delta subunit B
MIKEEKELSMSLQGAFKVQEMYAKVFEDMKKTLQELDSLCLDLSQNVTVDIMPGENDPSDDAMPQQPLNRAYFPSAYSSGNLNSASNPYVFSLDDVEILGTSGTLPRKFTDL